MPKTIERPTMAWINSSEIPSPIVYKSYVESAGFDLQEFHDAASALEKLSSVRYPVIFTEIDLDIGSTDNPDVLNVINKFDRKYSSTIILPMLSYLRQPSNPNHDSSIFVGGVYRPFNDPLFLNLTTRVKLAGASDYIYFLDASAKEFGERVKNLADNLLSKRAS